MNFSYRTALCATVFTAAAAGAWAQDVCATGVNEASFDFITLDCLQCTVHPSMRDSWIEYGAEPMIRAVTRTGVDVKPGDVVVAVDGMLITTPGGGRRLAHPQVEHATQFTIRRNGRQLEVTLMPAVLCDNDQLLAEGHSRLNRALLLLDSIRFGRDSLGRGHFSIRNDTSTVRQLRNGVTAWTIDSTGKTVTLRGELSDRVTRGLANAQMMASDSIHAGAGRGVGAGVLRAVGGGVLAGHLSIQVDSTGGGSVRRIVFTHNDSGRVVRGDTIYLNGRVGSYFNGRIDAVGGGRGGASTGASRGWLGFGLDCNDCASNQGADGQRVWHFGTAPAIAGIDPGGPAELAGVLAGDVLRAIDGVAITTAEGGVRFSSLKAGQRVRLTVDRHGRTVEIAMTVAPRTN